MERGGSRTLSRGLRVLRALGARDDGGTVAQLAADTALDRAVLYRLLDTLCDAGFASRDVATRTFHLGPALVELGSRASRGMAVRQHAIGPMQALMESTGEAVCLAVPDGGDLIVVERVEPEGLFVRVAYDVGMRHPLWRGAHGRVIAAHMDPEQVAAMRPMDWPDGLGADRSRGYSVSADELETGTSGVAAPVRDHDGRPIAALGVVAPTPRLPDPTSLGTVVSQAAAAVSAAMGFRG